jgi:hypothetical protein
MQRRCIRRWSRETRLVRDPIEIQGCVGRACLSIWIRVYAGRTMTSAGAECVGGLLSRVAWLGPANCPIHSHFIPPFFFLHFHFHPLSSSFRFLLAASTINNCGPVAKYRNNRACPSPTSSRTNGSSLPHNSLSANNTLLSHSHLVASLVKPHTSSIIVSTFRHVRCREKQSRRWRQAPETTQCLDHLSFRQAPKSAPSPSRPAKTDSGGGVQDHCCTMARRVGRCTRFVRSTRRDGQGGARTHVPRLSLRAREEGRQGSHARRKASG